MGDGRFESCDALCATINDLENFFCIVNHEIVSSMFIEMSRGEEKEKKIDEHEPKVKPARVR